MWKPELHVGPEALGFSSDRLKRLDSALQNQIVSGKYAAISVMIARHGKVILDSRTALRADAIFHIAKRSPANRTPAPLLICGG
jgi:hypothetical protein